MSRKDAWLQDKLRELIMHNIQKLTYWLWNDVKFRGYVWYALQTLTFELSGDTPF